MAQLVERLTLDFGSGHDIRVCEFQLRIGLYVHCVEAASDSLSLPLSLLLPCSHSLSLSLSLSKINKPKKIMEILLSTIGFIIRKVTTMSI